MAHATLTELLPPSRSHGDPDPFRDDPAAAADSGTDPDHDLLCLFDRITSSEQSPVFAAADLTILPLQLITDEDDSKNELLREIRQLKRFIQDALNGRVDEPAAQIDSGVQTINGDRPDSNLQGQSSGCCSSSPKSSLKSSTNASISSPELPTPASLFSTPCSSFVPTTMMSSVSPYRRSENHSTSDTSNSLLGITTSAHVINSSNDSSSNGTNIGGRFVSSVTNNYNRRKRDGCGNRLDAMIQKLADRQKEKEAAAALTGGTTSTSMSAISSTSTTSSSSSSASSTAVVPQEQSPPPATTIWHTQMIDPIAYVNMLRTMTGAAAAAATAVSSPSSIFPSINKTVQNDRSKNESVVEFGDNLEDGSIELGEKNSNESSPSPSDSSNNVDEATYTAADLAEKPFTCEHTNCHKRFANKFLLKKHQFIHTGLRPHCCPFCGKRFNRKDNLLRHKKTHLANALGTDITSALSSDDFLLQLGADKAAIKLENEPEEENEN